MSARPPALEGLAPIERAEAERLLARAVALPGADRVLAVLEARDESLTRFANNEIHQNVTSRQETLTLEARLGRRVGRASTSRLDIEGLRAVSERALALARLAPEDDELPDFGDPAPVPAGAGFVAATAACTPEERARAVGIVTEPAAARGLNAAGALSTTTRAVAVAHSLGQFAYHADTHARFTCTARSEDSSGWCDRHRHDWRELDVATLGATAMEKAERSRAPHAIEPGPYTVVLESSAVAELVAFLAWLGLGAQSLEEGRSFLSGKLGERITGAGVQIADDAFDPRSFGLPFDYEGTPRRRVPLIASGVGLGVVHDRRSAIKAGVASTGHATAPPAVEGPLPFDLVLDGGDQSLDELIAGTERGILVTRFWYNRVVDARRTLVTGMTRDGTFLIEGGRVAHGVRNLRFNESVLDLLARVDGWGRVAEPTVFDFSGNAVVVPPLRVREFHFTGVTTF